MNHLTNRTCLRTLPVIRRTSVHFPSYSDRPTIKPTLSPSMIPTQNPTANAGTPTLPVQFTGVLPAWQRFRGNNVNSGVYPNSLVALKTDINKQMLGPVTPQIKWSRSLVSTDSGEGGGTISSPIVDTSGNIWVATVDGKLVQYAPNGVCSIGIVPTGHSVWYQLPGIAYAKYGGYFISTPLLNNLQNMLYAGNTDGYLYKFMIKPWSITNNVPVWQFKTNGAIVSSPIQTNSTRISLIIVGSMDGNVYAVNDGPVLGQSAALGQSTAALVWVYPTGGL